MNEFRKFLVILRKDVQIEFSYRLGFVFRLISIFTLLLIFFFISEIFGPGVTPYLQSYGGNYFSFVLIGLSLSTFLNVGLITFANAVREEQKIGTLEMIISSPIRLTTYLFSALAWPFVFTAIQTVIYILIGVFLFKAELIFSQISIALVILALTVLAFSGLGIISAALVMVFKQGEAFAALFNIFNSLLGGIYYPVSVLPMILQKTALILPITHSLNALRAVLLSGASWRDVSGEVLTLLVFVAVLLPISLFCFHLAVRRAKYDGTLTHY